LFQRETTLATQRREWPRVWAISFWGFPCMARKTAWRRVRAMGSCSVC